MLAIAAPSFAEAAKRRVIVLNFTGPGGRKLQKAIVARIKREKYKVIPAAPFLATAKKLKASGVQPGADLVAQTAQKLKADAVVAGRVRKQRKQFSLVLSVRDAASGVEVAEVTIPLKGRKMTAASMAKVEEELIPALERAQGGGGAEIPVPQAKPEEKPPQPEQVPVPETPPPPPVEQAAPQHREVTEPAPPVATEETPAAPGARPEWRPYLKARLTVGAMMRTLSFEAPMARQGYDGGLMPAAAIEVDAHPFAGSGTSWLRGLGLSLGYSRALSVSTKCPPCTPPAGATEVSLDSSMQMLSVALEYGYRLREAANASTIGLRVGYALASFEITVPMAQMGIVTVPDVSYKYVDAGLFARIPFSTRWELGLRFSYLPVLSAGMITDGGRDLGGGMRSIAAGPNGSASGFGGGLTLEWKWTPRFGLLGRFQADRFSTSFEPGAQATSASDLFLQFGLGVSASY